MTEAPAVRKAPPQAQSSGSIHTLMTSRQPYMSEPIASKRVCFYKSGDAQFSGLPVVINNRTFKTFEALLDSLSKRVPLPFGVRTITTPRGHTTVRSLDQLHHGHSYICSDKRTVKPIDLERARRKPPPWYHARPVSNRRLARERQSPGLRSVRRARRNEHAALLHTPKRLVVFRNGDPEVKHTLLLQKRTTHSFETLLDLVSEVMHFPVLKLHMPDGRRVDGLPALILCSGVLVAAGRETFRKGNYDVQKPSAPTWLPAKSVGRRQPVSRKKKPMTSSTKSRPFSPSSERFIVNQIHNSFAGSAYDYPSNPTGSVEMETGQRLQSVAETDTIACLDGDGEGDIHMPTEDDIEKSFRVNQDGSMTVEMKVRLTIKEEETIHWTTTLSRSSVAGQIKPSSELHPDEAEPLSDHIAPDVDPVDSLVVQNYSEEHAFPEECTVAHEEMGREEEIIMVKEPLQPLPPTPGWRKVQQKQSVGSTRKITETEIHENVQESYAYREETSNGEIKQEHCMVRQSSSRPVPKPRSNLPAELNTAASLQSSTYKLAEILQLQDKEEEVHETVLHIYEQQTCQENFFANTQLCIQGMGTYSSAGGRPVSSDTVFPASSDKTPHSSSEDLESELHASSTYGALKRQENLIQSDLQTLGNQNILQEVSLCTPVTEFSKPSEARALSTGDTSKKRKPVRVVVKKNHIFQITAPERKRKENKVDKMKEIKKIRADIFSRAGTLRHTEHIRAKAVQKLLKRRNNPANGHGHVPTMSCNPVHLTIQSPKELSTEREQCTNKVNEISASPKKDLLHASSNKCALIRQTSMHEEQHFQRETQELSESISLPALHSSSSVFNEYVELWLQKSEPEQEEVRSTHSKLLESKTCLTPLELQPCSEVSQITGETVEAKETTEVTLQCCVSLHKSSSPRNHDDSPERISLSRDSSQENTSLSKTHTLKKDTLTRQLSPQTHSLQENTAENIPLSGNLSLKTSYDVESQAWSRNVSAKGKLLLNDNAIKSVSQGETSFARNVSVQTSQAISDNNSGSSESSKLPSHQVIKPFPRHLKISSHSKDSSLETERDTTLEGASTGNDHEKQKPFPGDPSKKSGLINQPSVEKIPKHNTMTKASKFNNKSEEDRLLPKIATSEKMQQRKTSTLKNVPKSTLSGKSQKSDSTKEREIQQNLISQEGISTGETNTCTSLGTLSEAHAQLRSSTEMTDLQAEKSYTVKMAVRPDMRHVLEELCHSIQSLREVTQHKRRSCLEKSNSTPDFSSHLTSTFGSSSRVLLAFLSVMTLKDDLASLNVCHQDQSNLSWSEPLLMLQSLKEMAAIEDAEQLTASLNALQNSTSIQLLQSWRGFQELSNISRSHSVTPGSSRSGSFSGPCSEEEAIQGLMEDLGVPDRVREELAALCSQEEDSIRSNQVEGLEKISESLTEVKMNGFTGSLLREKTLSFPESVLEDDVNTYVKSVIDKAVKAHLEDCGSSNVTMTHLLPSADEEIKVAANNKERELIQLKRTEQDDCGLDSDICEMSSQTTVMEEKQQKPDKPVLKPMKTEETEMVLVSHKKQQDIDDMAKKEVDEGRVVEKEPKTLDSPNSSEDKLTTSEEEKSSLGEDDDSCDEELMSFSEDQVTDKEENYLINPTAGIKNTTMESLSKWQRESQENQEESQQDSRTDSVEKHNGAPELQTTLLTIHVESHVKDKTHHDTEHQKVTYEERTIYSEEDQLVLEAPECYTIYQEHFVEKTDAGPEDPVEYEENTVQLTGKKKCSVAELISNLESVTETPSNIPKKPDNKFLAHIEVPDISDTADTVNVIQTSSEQELKNTRQVQTQNKSDNEKHIKSVSPEELPKTSKTTKQPHIDLTSEPLSSSLAFSYDSRSSSLAQESEGSIQVNRVKSIREMFLARSNTKTQNGQTLHSPNLDMSDYQAEFSDSGGNQSQTSPETSSGEDDTSRLTIAKGFVRRTIERLYGRGNSNSTGPDDKRPLSASKGRQRAGPGPGRTNVTTLASFHEARSCVKTDLSYFNATSSLDVFNEPTHCVTLNAQLGQEDAVLIDKGRWLLRENILIQETSPERQESQKKVEKDTTVLVEPEQDTVKEDVPYSLFCPASPHKALPSSELEELAGSLGPKITYFNLPNASDSELEPQGRNTDAIEKSEAKVTPVTQSPRSWVEKNSILPAFNPPVIKKTDNKVHPLLEAFKLPVVKQPARGQSAQTEVTRRSTEPDVLEMLFIFCGQHCPIL